MILGTSIFLSKSGPGDLRIITKMLQKLQEKYGIILDKYYFCQSGTSKNWKNWNLYVPGTRFFRFLSICFSIAPCFFWFSGVFWVYILKIILRRWGIENDTFFIIKQHPNLDSNFISIKKHETEITLNFLIFKDGTLNFSIFKKGDHKTLISRY